MTEIKVGPELDRAVAEVVGVPMPPWASEPYSPSTDLNAAFAAAKRVWTEFTVRRRPSGKYEPMAFCNGDDGWSRFDEQRYNPGKQDVNKILAGKRRFRRKQFVGRQVKI